MLNAAFLNYRVDITPSWDPSSKQENQRGENELHDEQTEITSSDEKNQNNWKYSEAVSSELHTITLSDSEINSRIRSLNIKKRQIFNFICHNM